MNQNTQSYLNRKSLISRSKHNCAASQDISQKEHVIHGDTGEEIKTVDSESSERDYSVNLEKIKRTAQLILPFIPAPVHSLSAILSSKAGVIT